MKIFLVEGFHKIHHITYCIRSTLYFTMYCDVDKKYILQIQCIIQYINL